VSDEEQPPAAKKRGRPTDPLSKRQTGSNITFRARAGLKEQLGAHASSRGRSISEEVESRIDSSFRNDDFVNALIGSPLLASYLRLLIAPLGVLERANGRSVFADESTKARARRIVQRITDATLPPAQGLTVQQQQEAENEADLIAAAFIHAASSANDDDERLSA
jgi:hypothetical protein